MRIVKTTLYIPQMRLKLSFYNTIRYFLIDTQLFSELLSTNSTKQVRLNVPLEPLNGQGGMGEGGGGLGEPTPSIFF